MFPRRFLNDVLWAQYCLFLHVRILDDLYDQHVQDPSLAYTAQLFKLEADGIFLKYFASARRFWNDYRGYYSKTISAIVRVDRLQQAAGADPKKILSGYMDVCSIFKIGSLAICCYGKRMHLLPDVAAFADALAAIGQAMDDLEDLQQDIGRGRYNFVSTFLLKQQKSATERRGDISSSWSNADKALAKLFLTLNKHLQVAERAAKKLKSTEMGEYCNWVGETLTKLEQQLHLMKVKWIFRDYVPVQPE